MRSINTGKEYKYRQVRSINTGKEYKYRQAEIILKGKERRGGEHTYWSQGLCTTVRKN